MYKVYLFLMTFILTLLLILSGRVVYGSQVETVYEARPSRVDTTKKEAEKVNLEKVVFTLSGKKISKFRIELKNGKKYYSVDSLETNFNIELPLLRRFLGYAAFETYGGYNVYDYYIVKLQSETFEPKSEDSEGQGGLLSGLTSFFERLIDGIAKLPSKVFELFKGFLGELVENIKTFFEKIFVPKKEEIDKKVKVFLEKTDILGGFELGNSASPFSGIFSRVPPGVVSSVYNFSRILIWLSASIYAINAIRRISDGNASNS